MTITKIERHLVKQPAEVPDSAIRLADYIVGEGRALATLAEVCTGLTLAPSKLRNDVRRGLAQPTRLGRRVAFSREQIAAYITALEAEAARAA